MKVFITLIFFAHFATIIQAELKLLSVVFRHGDRVPDSTGYEEYPNDPYAEETYYPIGSGGLTNAGKRREYRLGLYLRKHYGHFLGSTYTKGIVNARSTHIERARLCVQLVLAALFIPRGEQMWNPKVNWQPIPTTTVPHLDDVLMFPQECPRALLAAKKVMDSPEYQKQQDEFVPLMNNLTIWTGKSIKDSIDMYYLYHGLSATQGMNLQLPQWTEGIFPDGQLYDGTLLSYKLLSYNDEMKRLNGGMLLRKITDDMTAACEGRLKEPKIFLYSGHEFNVAALLQALDVFKPHIPRYSSAVIVELHKQHRECYVEVKYYKGFVSPSDEDQSIEKVMSIPGCSSMCPLGEFKEILKNHIATDEDIVSCDKRSMPEFVNTHKDLPATLVNYVLHDVYEERKNTLKLM